MMACSKGYLFARWDKKQEVVKHRDVAGGMKLPVTLDLPYAVLVGGEVG